VTDDTSSRIAAVQALIVMPMVLMTPFPSLLKQECPEVSMVHPRVRQRRYITLFVDLTWAETSLVYDTRSARSMED
jgi:hypothetical protein